MAAPLPYRGIIGNQGLRFDVQGAKELERALRDLPNKVANKVTRQALRAASKPIQARAKLLAPKDTGLLKRSIKVRAMKRKKGRIGILVSTSKSGNLFTGKAFYGAFIEFGHYAGPRARGKARDRKNVSEEVFAHGRKWIPPRPFMRPAFEALKYQARDTIEKLMWEGIKREVAALAKGAVA